MEDRVSLKLKPGTQSGQKLRLKGKGMPGTSKSRGNLYAVVSIKVPAALSARVLVVPFFHVPGLGWARCFTMLIFSAEAVLEKAEGRPV